MTSITSAGIVEWVKLKRQPIVWISFITILVGPLMGMLFMGILSHPEWAEKSPLLANKANAMSIIVNWDSYFQVQLQALAVGGMLIFGFISAWMFGKEYADRTHTLWLSLPTSRTRIITAKFLVLTLWGVSLVFTQICATILFGLVSSLPGWDTMSILPWMNHMFTIFILLWLLCLPIAWMASIGKGYMAPLGFLILAIVLAQLLGAIGCGAWFPWSIPAIHAGMIQEPIYWVQYLLVVLTGSSGAWGTYFWWKKKDQ